MNRRTPVRAAGARRDPSGGSRALRRGLATAALTAFTALAAALSVVLCAPPASAHPVGNISINQAHLLTFRHDRVDDVALLDEAEIPTLQARPARDRDNDGTLSAAELAAYAEATCPRIAHGLTLRVASRDVAWTVTGARAEQLPGAAGLPTTRTECALTARADLSRRTDVTVANTNHENRVGWREFTIHGDGIAFDRTDLPRTSPSEGLRSYPDNLLANPLDVRRIELTTQPGTDTSAAATPEDGRDPAPWDRAYAALQRRFDTLVGADEVTVTAGALATLLAVLLGASHAALPGHGKTIMAVHLATRGADGRRQGIRDAFTVGATVTVTHTAGVLATGALLTASTTVTSESVMRWLGLASGLLVTAVGASLLRGALATTRAPRSASPSPGNDAAPPDNDRDRSLVHALPSRGAPTATQAHHPAVPGTGGGDEPPGDHQERPPAHAYAHAGGLGTAHAPAPAHPTHGLLHTHHQEPQQHEQRLKHRGLWGHGHHHGPSGDPHTHLGHHHSHHHGHHPHPHSHPHSHAHPHPPATPRAHIGMGIVGGLVPSPSALVVLLGTIALGHTLFGVLLVLAYGLGMAAVLTAAGLLLVRFRPRIPLRPHRAFAHTPVVTAAFILLVGVVLTYRALH